ncbi:MAG: hypothetical protein ABSE59_07315 [Opitutaceae bacterium]|jgi:hypothetical protein
MKSLKQLAAITLFGALAGVGLHAQTVDLRATIPFDLTVGQASLPAGDYEIHEQGVVVLVRRLDGKPANAIVTTVGVGGAESGGSPRLTFHRYGNEYFLSEIWNPESGGGRGVPRTGHEAEVAKRLGSAVEATVLANKR